MAKNQEGKFLHAHVLPKGYKGEGEKTFNKKDNPTTPFTSSTLYIRSIGTIAG